MYISWDLFKYVWFQTMCRLILVMARRMLWRTMGARTEGLRCLYCVISLVIQSSCLFTNQKKSNFFTTMCNTMLHVYRAVWSRDPSPSQKGTRTPIFSLTRLVISFLQNVYADGLSHLLTSVYGMRINYIMISSHYSCWQMVSSEDCQCNVVRHYFAHRSTTWWTPIKFLNKHSHTKCIRYERVVGKLGFICIDLSKLPLYIVDLLQWKLFLVIIKWNPYTIKDNSFSRSVRLLNLTMM